MSLPTRRTVLGAMGVALATAGLDRQAAAETQAVALETFVSGSGERVVFVHGSNLDGPLTWAEQKPLSARWRTEIVNRRGFGGSPPVDGRQDFEVDARDIVRALGPGAHLVGHSYGALASLYAAAIRPEAVRSLTVNEPPAFGMLKGDPEADELAARIDELKQRITEPRAYLAAFAALLSGPGGPPPAPLPATLPPEIEQGVRVSMAGRDPAEARIPFDALRTTTFPKLVTSGGHHPVFEKVCDLIGRELHTERAVIRGAGHAVPRTGASFNERLGAFLAAAG